MRSLLVLVSLVFPSLAVAASPVEIKPEFALTRAEVAAGKVLATWNGKAIVRGPDFQNNQNLFMTTAPRENFVRFGRYGKLVAHDPAGVAVFEITTSAALENIAGDIHEATGACGSIRWLSGRLPVQAMRSLPAPIHPIAPSGEAFARVAAALPEIQAGNIGNYIRTLVSWETRFHGHPVGKTTAERLRALYEAERPADRADVSFRLFRHNRTPQASLIVRIEGRTEPSKVIVLGSHLDAINTSTQNNVTPGADDNGSGTATNLEIFRALMRQGIRPARTIEIHAYAAEEIGLVGSNEIATDYNAKGVDVGAMVQFDMNIYKKSGADMIWFVSNGTSPALTQVLGNLVDTYVRVPWATKQLWFGTSDHASWSETGVPAAFPTEDPGNFNVALHTSRDTVETANVFSQAAAHAKTGLAFLMHYAGY